MAGINVRSYGVVELDEKNVKVLPTTEPIKVKDLYRDNSFEINEE